VYIGGPRARAIPRALLQVEAEMRYVFGNFTMDSDRLELEVGGELRPVEPQVFDVLRHLVHNSGHVVSSQELIDEVWGGRIVSDAAIASRIRDVRRALDDDGKEQRWIRTIRGRGFRFVGDAAEEVSAGTIPAVARSEAEPADPALSARSEQIASEVLCRPAVAVLPFEDHSENTAAGYLADGLSDEVVSALCAWRWFPVIARNTSARFRNSPLGASEIGRACGARYLLQGSMRCDRTRIKLFVNLIDAERDIAIWSTKIARPMDDLLTLEEEIASEVVSALEPEIQGAEMQRVLRKASEDVNAWDLAMRAKWHAFRGEPGDFEKAERLASEAATREPAWYLPYTLVAQCRFQRAMTDFSGSDARTAFSGTLAAARQALEIDRGAWLAHALTGVGELWTNQNHDLALQHVHHAIALNPSAAQTYHFGGCISGFSGDPRVARRHQGRIEKLDTAYPYAAVVESDLGLWHLLEGDLDAADDHLARAEALDPRYPRALHRRISLSGHQGRRDEARRAENRLRELGLPLDRDALMISYPFREARHQDLFFDGFRRAGFNL
jgi:TolB-like protein/Tfp pilus assembly protein PilF